MTLLDLTRELFTYLVVFRQRAVSPAPPSLETVSDELEAIFRVMEEHAREHPLLSGPYGQVRYGLAVLCDEILLSSGWPRAVDWAQEPLEERLYGSRQGGTRFFRLLEELRKAPKDVLAIYYLCLGLGFCGRYGPDDPQLASIKAGLLERMRPPLAPEPAPQFSSPRRRTQPPLEEPPPATSQPLPMAEEPPPPQAEPAPAPEAGPPPPAEPVASPLPRAQASPHPKPEPPPQMDTQDQPWEAPAPPPAAIAPGPTPAAPSIPPASAPWRPPGRRAAPAPPRRGRWRATALALGAVGLAGLLLWMGLGPWPSSPPARHIQLARQTFPPPPPAAEPAPAPPPELAAAAPAASAPEAVSPAPALSPPATPPEPASEPAAPPAPAPPLELAAAAPAASAPEAVSPEAAPTPPPDPPNPDPAPEPHATPAPALAAAAPAPEAASPAPALSPPAAPPEPVAAAPATPTPGTDKSPETAPLPAAPPPAPQAEPAATAPATPTPGTDKSPETAPPAAPPPAPQAEPGVYILHAGLYVGPIQSGRLAQRLRQAGLPAYVRQETRGEGKLRYLVLVGPYGQEAQAQEAALLIERRFKIRPFFMEPPISAPAAVSDPAGSGGSR